MDECDSNLDVFVLGVLKSSRDPHANILNTSSSYLQQDMCAQQRPKVCRLRCSNLPLLSSSKLGCQSSCSFYSLSASYATLNTLLLRSLPAALRNREQFKKPYQYILLTMRLKLTTHRLVLLPRLQQILWLIVPHG